MTTFDKREEGFEKQFAHDEELKFKATSRRNKLLGLWAAEKLGRKGPDAETYAKEVVMADFEEAGEDDVFRKVRKDFDASGVAATDQEIRTTMIELMGKAVEQIKTGYVAARRRYKLAIQSGPHRWHRSPAFPSPRGCAPARPSTPAGAACPRRWWRRSSPAKASRRSRSTRSTACGTSPGSRPASPPCARADRRRSCACRSATSPWSAACSISARKASSRR